MKPTWALALLVLGTLGLITLAETLPESSASAGVWVSKAAMPTARSGVASAAVNGKLYVIGGTNGDGSVRYSTVEVYDPVSDTWGTVAPMPTARANVAAASLNGRIYVIGGESGGTALSTVEVYDPGSDTWGTAAPMPTARDGLAAAAVGGTIYAIGGTTTGFNSFATVEAYDPIGNTWTTKAPMPTPRFGLGAAVVGSTIYAVAGAQPFLPLQTLEAYDTTTDTWTSKAPMTTVARYQLAAAAAGSTVYAIGGCYCATLYDAVEAYDSATNVWAPVASLPTARSGLGAGVIDGIVYAVGGTTGYGVVGAVNEAYVSPSGQSPTPTPSSTATSTATPTPTSPPPPTATSTMTPTATLTPPPNACHVVGDSDCDHLPDWQDPQPYVYCAAAHADADGSGSLNPIDAQRVFGSAINPQAPFNALFDQNHNGIVDWLDVVYVFNTYARTGGGSVVSLCSSATPDAMAPSGLGSTSGPELQLLAPQYLDGTEFNTYVSLNTGPTAPSPYVGYVANISFDPAVVRAVNTKNLSPFSCLWTAIDNDSGRVRIWCSSASARSYVGTLAGLGFSVVGPGDPRFCINSFAAPDNAGVVGATFTIGADVGPEVQSMPTPCGLPRLTAGGTLGTTSSGDRAMVRLALQSVSLRWDVPATVTVSYYTSDGSCSSTAPLVAPLAMVTSNGYVYSLSFNVPASCHAGATFTKCVDVNSTLYGCLSERLVDPSGYVYLAGFPDSRVGGASVSLERFDGANFVPVDPVANAGQYEPLDNPETTGADGQYAWDVVSGVYRVVVSKPGCTTATSDAVNVPPPVTTLNIALTCDPGTDTDGDACPDVGELVLVPTTSPNNRWDFYSVPVPALIAAPDPLIVFADGTVGAGDAQSVFAYFKAGAKTGTTEYEQDLNANGTRDGIEYDRSVVGPGISGPPDGVVGAADAQLAFAQFKLGYHC